ncbi:hypothetical protein DFS33DRAFT_21345 [Desarmillaria ectypa]|nr:hypothetical protein DFS33DRAFT_21345 [Desarmillaria ectypa]
MSKGERQRRAYNRARYKETDILSSVFIHPQHMMSNRKDIETHAAPIHKYYHQQPSRDVKLGTLRNILVAGTSKDLRQHKHANEYDMAMRHEPVMAFELSLHDRSLAYQQALEWAQSLPEVWKRPTSNDTVHYFPFTDTLRIRLWDSNISRRPDSSMHVFGLDFVDTHGEPQYVGPEVVVVAGRRASSGPEAEGNALVPIDGVGGPEKTVPERYGVVADCEYFFLAGRGTVVAYMFAQDLLD